MYIEIHEFSGLYNNYTFTIINSDYHVVVVSCCCCQPTPPCLFRGVLPYFEVTGHPVPVSSLGFKCPDCFIWNCSYTVYPSKMKGPFRDNCLRYFYLLLAFLMAGCVESIRRALVLGLVLIAGTAIELAPSVGPLSDVVVGHPSTEYGGEVQQPFLRTPAVGISPSSRHPDPLVDWCPLHSTSRCPTYTGAVYKSMTFSCVFM